MAIANRTHDREFMFRATAKRKKQGKRLLRILPRWILIATWNTYGQQLAPTLKCKLLLPKFNTWKQVLPERQNRFRLPFRVTANWFSTMISCQNRQKSSASRRKADAITAQSRCLHAAKPMRLRRKADDDCQFQQCLGTVKNASVWYSVIYQKLSRIAFLRPRDGLIEKKRFPEGLL